MPATCVKTRRPSLWTAHSESTTLGVRQAKRPRAQVFSEDPILLPEIVDQIVLVTVHPASEREDEELQRRRHSLRLLGRLDQHRPSLGRFFAPYAVDTRTPGRCPRRRTPPPSPSWRAPSRRPSLIVLVARQRFQGDPQQLGNFFLERDDRLRPLQAADQASDRLGRPASSVAAAECSLCCPSQHVRERSTRQWFRCARRHGSTTVVSSFSVEIS